MFFFCVEFNEIAPVNSDENGNCEMVPMDKMVTSKKKEKMNCYTKYSWIIDTNEYFWFNFSNGLFFYLRLHKEKNQCKTFIKLIQHCTLNFRMVFESGLPQNPFQCSFSMVMIIDFQFTWCFIQLDESRTCSHISRDSMFCPSDQYIHM